MLIYWFVLREKKEKMLLSEKTPPLPEIEITRPPLLGDEEATEEEEEERETITFTPNAKALRKQHLSLEPSETFRIDAPTPSSCHTGRKARTDEDRMVPPEVICVGNRILVADAVFDGHGGSAAADFLALHCRDYVAQRLTRNPNIDLETLLVESIDKLENDLLRELCWQERDYSGASGSIVLTELLAGDVLRIACGNIGDCDVKIVSSDGECAELSETHRISNPGERRRIEQLHGYITEDNRICHLIRFRDARDENEKERVTQYHATGLGWGASTSNSIQPTRSFGDYKWKYRRKGIANVATVSEHIERGSSQWDLICDALYQLLSAEPFTKVMEKRSDDRWLALGSDGFWDAFPNDEIGHFLLQANHRGEDESLINLTHSLADKARALIPAEEGAADDVSVILIDLTQRIRDHQIYQSFKSWPQENNARKALEF